MAMNVKVEYVKDYKVYVRNFDNYDEAEKYVKDNNLSDTAEVELMDIGFPSL